MIQGENLKKEITKMKGRVSVLSLLLSIILIASVCSTAASPTATINVDPPSLQLGIGEVKTVNINITNVEEPGVYGWELKLYFNNTLLNLTEALYPPGHFLPSPTFEVPVNVTESNEKGFAHFSVIRLGDVPGVTGSGILAAVKFNGTKIGTSALEIRDATLLDSNGTEIQYVGNNGIINIIPEFTPALIMFAFMAITLVAIVLGKQVSSKKHSLH